MGSESGESPRPNMPSVPLESMLEAADELGPRSKLRVALVLLVQKIDKGFSAMLFFMNTARDAQKKLGEEVAELRKEVSDLRKLMADRTAADNTASHKLAKLEGLREAEDRIAAQTIDREKMTLEWKKASVPLKVAFVGGGLAIAKVLIEAVAALFK